MQETRRARLASAIQQELSMVIQRELKDPRIPPLVTLTSVEVTQDGSQATVFVSILGTGQIELSEAEQHRQDQEMRGALEGLKSASGLLRKHLGRVLTV